MQSTLLKSELLHVAIIMDGNGRWASRRFQPRAAGHKSGIDAIRRLLETAPPSIGTLTLFAFSSDNWRRPLGEVTALMGLLQNYLQSETSRLVDSGVRLCVIGRRDRLPEGLETAIAAAEHQTREGTRLVLRVALDYSARDAIVMAAARCGLGLTRETFARALAGSHVTPDVDLLIRTGGERRLSDFLLWECAYAELHFTEVMWPDFDAATLNAALDDFRKRDRRFGGLVPLPCAPAAA